MMLRLQKVWALEVLMLMVWNLVWANGQYGQPYQPTTMQNNNYEIQGSSQMGLVPPYIRGEGKYQYVLKEAYRHRGVQLAGYEERLRVKMDLVLQKRRPIKVAAVGASVTAGHGVTPSYAWPRCLFNYLEDHYPNMTSGQVAAVPGTVSSYMALCHNTVVPRDADIIFMEYSLNDSPQAHPLFDNNDRKPYEQLLRKFLNYPNQPAVVLIHSFMWHKHPIIIDRNWWHGAERELSQIGMYYGVPQLSVRGCCFHLMKKNVDGFRVDRVTQELRGPETATNASYFFNDPIHPGITGHRVIAELAIHVLETAAASLKSRPMSEEEVASAEQSLPSPMVAHNYESMFDACYIGEEFRQMAVSKEDWEWVDDARNGFTTKLGYMTKKVDAKLRIKVDMMTLPASLRYTSGQQMVLQVSFLRSHHGMGQMMVDCEAGCSCIRSLVDGHQQVKNTQLFTHAVAMTSTPSSEACIITFTAEQHPTHGGKRVKVAGVTISVLDSKAKPVLGTTMAGNLGH